MVQRYSFIDARRAEPRSRSGIPTLTRVAAAMVLVGAGGGCSRCGGSGAPLATTATNGGSASSAAPTASDGDSATPVGKAPGATGSAASPASPRVDGDAGDPACFSVGYGQNSVGTTALFARRDLQSGGPTWVGVLGVVVRRHATFVREVTKRERDMPGFGAPSIVRYSGRETWVIVDDEGEGAILCAGDPALLQELRADYDHLDANAKELERTLDKVPPRELE